MLEIPPEARVIFVEEFNRQIRRRSWQILTLLIPLLLLIGWGTAPLVRNAVTDDEPTTPLSSIGYVDEAGVTLDVSAENRPVPYESVDEGAAALLRDEVDAVFVLREDYLATGSVEWLRDDSGFLSDDSLGPLFTDFMTRELIAGYVEPSVLDRVVRPTDYLVYEVAEDGTISEEPPDAQQAGEFFVPFVFAVLLMIAIFSGSGSLLQSVADEKENRMIEMIITSATPLSIMAGKVFALGAAGLIQVTVWVVSAAIVAPLIIGQIPNAGDLAVGLDLLAIVLVMFIAGYFLFAVIMAGMGAATTSVREASQISALITFPAVIPIWFSSLLISNPGGVVAQVLSYVPLTAPTTILIRLSVGNVSPFEIIGSLLAVLGCAMILLWVSARIFRAGLLLYGQRMSLKNVWSALKEAD